MYCIHFYLSAGPSLINVYYAKETQCRQETEVRRNMQPGQQQQQQQEKNSNTQRGNHVTCHALTAADGQLDKLAYINMNTIHSNACL